MGRKAIGSAALAALVIGVTLTLPAEGQQGTSQPQAGDRFDPVDTQPVPVGALTAGAAVREARELGRYREVIARSPEHKADRRRHADDDADETRAEALATLREEYPDVADAEPWDPLRLKPGDELKRYSGVYAAQVATQDHGTQLVTSQLPLRSAVGSGELERVSLEMREGDETFRPANPLVKTVIEKDFDEGMAFPEQGYRIRLSGAGKTDPLMEVGDKVFVGNLGEDLDALITPTPTGVSTTLQVRSPDAPEQLAYQFQLRDGMSLRTRHGDLGDMSVVGVEVVDGERPVAFVAMPGAVDADGREVPVAMTLEPDDKVVLTFSHRDEDFRFPLAVDPVIDNYQIDSAGARLNNQDPFAGWSFFGNSNNNLAIRQDPRNTDSTALGNIRGNSIFGNGLYVLVDRANVYHRGGTIGQWVWTAPGRSFMRRADFGYVTHVPNNSCIVQGVYAIGRPGGPNWDPGRWEHPPDQAVRSGPTPFRGFQGAGNANACGQFDNNYKAHYLNDPPTPANQMVFAWALDAGVEKLRSNGGAYMYGATMWLDDADIPTLGAIDASYSVGGNPSVISGLPQGWIGDSLIRVGADASDAGLGVKELTIGAPGADGLPKFFRNTHPCTGDRGARCPNLWSRTNNFVNFSTETLQEGNLSLNLSATDILGKPSTLASFPVKLDRNPPDIRLSGRLHELRDQELFAQDYALQVDARDAGSGVKRVEVLVGGTVRATTGDLDCPNGGGCAVPLSFSLDAADEQYEVGRHTVEVRATDQMDRMASRSFDVTVSAVDPLVTEAELVSKSISFRQREGLRADEPYIRTLINDPRYNDARAEFHVPLTEAEVAQLDPDQAIARSTSTHPMSQPLPEEEGALPPDDYGRTQAADSYAGYYIKDGLYYVGFTNNADEHLAALKQTFPEPDKLRLFPASLTEIQLQALFSAVSDAKGELGDLGYVVSVIEESIEDNRIRVGLTNVVPGALAHFLDRFGPNVELVEMDVEPAARRVGFRAQTRSPVIGGLQIRSPSPAPEVECTAGFPIEQKSFTNAGVTFQAGILTAAHCTGSEGESWLQGAVSLGPVVRRAFGGGSVDAAIIATNRPLAGAIALDATRRREIRSIALRKQEGRFRRPCWSGSRTAQCGRFVTRNAEISAIDRNGRRMILFAQRGISERCSVGDSGAPVYSGSVALGVVTFRSKFGPPRCYYSQIENVFRRLN